MKFLFNVAYYVVFVFGLSFSFFFLFGLVADFRSIDKTPDSSRKFLVRTVSPENFALFFTTTENGVVKHGFVSDYHIDCTTGVITFRITREYVLNYNYFTRRAFDVYKPADICRAGGFISEFE